MQSKPLSLAGLAGAGSRHARGPLLWRAYGAAGIACVVAYFLVGRGSSAQAAIYQLFSLSAPVAIFVGLRRYRPAGYRAWLLLAAGLLLWVAGDAYWNSYRWVLHRQAPYPSFADWAYIGGYPLLAAGVLVLSRGWGRPRIGDVLDGAIVSVAAAVVTWVVVLEPIAHAQGLSRTAMALSVTTPVADFVLLVAVTQLAFRGRVPNFALRSITASLLIVLVTDFVYARLNVEGTYSSGMALDAGWFVAYLLWGVAALHPSMRLLRSLPHTDDGRLSFWRVGVLTAALLAPPVALTVEASMERSNDLLAIGGASILTTLLVAARVTLLRRHRAQIEAQLVTSERRYRDLFAEAHEARVALAEQNEQLRELDQMKDELLALVSHELRTPLTSILGYLDLVCTEAVELDDEHRGFLEVVTRNAERLLRLVSDLLFAAQVQAGRLTLARETFDLNELGEECVAAARPTAATRGVELTLHRSSSASVDGDRQRLAQVLDNLLSNALKFTPPGGSVDLRLEQAHGVSVVEVADTGLGIAAAEQDQLFTPFFRTEAAMTKTIQGTGLGLSIVKAIVEAHGGEIVVNSVEGEGATFRVTLPQAVRPATLVAAEAA